MQMVIAERALLVVVKRGTCSCKRIANSGARASMPLRCLTGIASVRDMPTLAYIARVIAISP